MSCRATQRGKALAELAGVSGRNSLAFLDHMIELRIAGQIAEIQGLRIDSVEGLIS